MTGVHAVAIFFVKLKICSVAKIRPNRTIRSSIFSGAEIRKKTVANFSKVKHLALNIFFNVKFGY